MVTPQTAGSGGVWITAAIFGLVRAAWVSPERPPFRPHTTKAPTARKAASLTTNSAAIARMRPSWCSFGLMRRVPKAMAKAASTRAIASENEADGRVAVSRAVSNDATTVRSVVETALSCRAT